MGGARSDDSEAIDSSITDDARRSRAPTTELADSNPLQKLKLGPNEDVPLPPTPDTSNARRTWCARVFVCLCAYVGHVMVLFTIGAMPSLLLRKL